jgi:hypothetical protein
MVGDDIAIELSSSLRDEIAAVERAAHDAADGGRVLERTAIAATLDAEPGRNLRMRKNIDPMCSPA